MNEVLRKVRRFIELHSMFNGARGVVVAVSGGPDSLALLDILMRIKEDGRELSDKIALSPCSRSIDTAPPAPGSLPISPGMRLHVAHLNHKLRGQESDEDAEFVRARAEQLGLARTIALADVYSEARASGRGIEEVAREIRYEFLLATARKTGCDRIATGHTMSDQAETFLMRLTRGTGLRGLAAMRAVTVAHFFNSRRVWQAEEERRGGEDAEMQRVGDEAKEYRQPTIDHRQPTLDTLLIRPLLCITREEVELYCRDRGIEFRTDATNLDTNYGRNQMRHNVLPSLRAINPRVVESIARAAEIAAHDQDALGHYASSLLDQARRSSSDGERGAYMVANLLAQPTGMRRQMLMEAIRRARADANQSVHDRLHKAQVVSKHVDAVERLLEDRESGKHIVLPDGLEVWREFDALVFRLQGKSEQTFIETLYECEGKHFLIEAGGLRITLLRGQPGSLIQIYLNQARREKERNGRDWMVAVLDDGAVPEKLIVRPRLPGERARVPGQRSAKKLKRLMIDHKISPSRRTVWPVVTTADGRYIWSPGLPPAIEFAARADSSSLAIFRASSV